MTGNAGVNLLSGLASNDVLTGGGGIDTLDGGVGNDKFVYKLLTDSAVGTSHDVIVGFDGAGNGAGDQVNLSALDADIGAPLAVPVGRPGAPPAYE